MPENLPNIVFDKKLYFKDEKENASDYAFEKAWKNPIFESVEKADGDDRDSYDDQRTWVNPNAREINPENCDKVDLERFCKNLCRCIPLIMGFLPGCGGMRMIDCPLSKEMGGWRQFSKFEKMTERVDHENDSKV